MLTKVFNIWNVDAHKLHQTFILLWDMMLFFEVHANSHNEN